MIRPISNLKNIHRGSDIYVIASGPSSDHIDPSFFEGKLTIGVNQVYRKFKCKYLVRKEASYIKESIQSGAEVICSLWDSGDITKGKKKKNQEGNEGLNFYVFDHNENRHTQIDFSIIGSDKIIVSYSTITSAIHVAAYMGAKNIIIVGHDCGLLNDKHVFDGYYKSISETPWKNWEEYKKWLSVIENQSISVKKELCKKYRCNIYSLNPFINYNLEGNSFKGSNKIN
jgi:hypothetical protein